jgi:hypothetical protein
MKRRVQVAVFLAGLLFMAAGRATSDDNRSDLLKVRSFSRGGDATVQLMQGRGPCITNDGVLCDGVFDLLGNAPFVDFAAEPFFDAAEFPGAPMRYRVTFGPVTLRPNQRFFGLVGLDYEPGDFPGPLSEETFRREILANFEAEVDGLAVRADRFEFKGDVPLDGGAALFSYFNYTQALERNGSHHLVYRFNVSRTLGDCNVDCLPAGLWEYHFTVVIKPAHHHTSLQSGSDREGSGRPAQGCRPGVQRIRSLGDRVRGHGRDTQ